MPLHSRYIIWQVMIVGRSCVFSLNHVDVVFPWISRLIYIAWSKIGDSVFTSSNLSLISITLHLQCHVSILNGAYLVVTACDDKLMIFLHLICKLLPNMWEHHIAVVSSEVFCFSLLTRK